MFLRRKTSRNVLKFLLFYEVKYFAGVFSTLSTYFHWYLRGSVNLYGRELLKLELESRWGSEQENCRPVFS